MKEPLPETDLSRNLSELFRRKFTEKNISPDPKRQFVEKQLRKKKPKKPGAKWRPNPLENASYD